jgi:hypothetical protein
MTIPRYIPAFNSMSEAYLSIPYAQYKRDIAIVFKAKFSATGFAIKINPYKVVLC